MQVRVLDVFADPAAWSAVASGEAQLTIAAEPGPRGPALRLDFDFHGGGGFVVARRLIALTLPDAYAFRFDVRGAAPANAFELKLADPANVNVWRWREPALRLPGRLAAPWTCAAGSSSTPGARPGAVRRTPSVPWSSPSSPVPAARGRCGSTDLCLVDRTDPGGAPGQRLQQSPRLPARGGPGRSAGHLLARAVRGGCRGLDHRLSRAARIRRPGVALGAGRPGLRLPGPGRR